MRKTDLLIVIVVAALGAAWWQQKGPPPPAAPMTTSSGRWTVLPNRYHLAGLSIGMSEPEIVAQLGQPSHKNQENAESSSWTYSSDGAELNLALLEGRLIMVAGTGRWSLTEGEKPLPGFQSSPDQLLAAFGEPQRKDDGAKAWVYTQRPGELTFHFLQNRVSQMVVTGEISPQKLSQ